MKMRAQHLNTTKSEVYLATCLNYMESWNKAAAASLDWIAVEDSMMQMKKKILSR